nr:sugar-binding transcriptional regulator [Corynebacterium lactis]
MDSRDIQALTAVKLYYGEGLTQSQVADELGVSRPTVSKLLNWGRERGYVSIEIHDPREEASEIGSRMREHYGLAEVRLAQPARSGNSVLLRELGRVGAELLDDLVVDGTMVGVSWGKTMYSVSTQLKQKDVSGVEIVQLKGGMSHSDKSTNDIRTIGAFCHAFHAYARTLPLPVIFDSVETKRIVEQDRFIASVLALGRAVDIAVFTVGAVNEDSLALNLGQLTEQEKELLVARAAGDACSRFYREDGGVALPEVDARTVGISLADLRRIPTRVLIAGGAKKSRAIDVALKTGLATHLVIDDSTAGRLLGVEAD